MHPAVCTNSGFCYKGNDPGFLDMKECLSKEYMASA